ncbi:hypothetical protein [Mucilaginibacter sp.]|uniref:hypothetical protein n=1 Tax=Mucilaginibacter sp. TaxID=1882438 RepID=UPI0025D8E317|nr:hypothetical protein [Mucilaginibacter sp.]
MEAVEKLSKKDMKCIELFKILITKTSDADTVRKTMTRIYLNYTKMLIADINWIGAQNDTELYHLGELIEILDGGYD